MEGIDLFGKILICTKDKRNEGQFKILRSASASSLPLKNLLII